MRVTHYAMSLPLTLVLACILNSARAQSPPTYLSGADAERVDELERKSGECESRDDLPGAIKAAAEVVALRTRLQGEDHWQTRTARRQVETLKKMAAFTAEQKSEFAAARKQLQDGNSLATQGQFAEAQKAYEKALVGYCRLLGANNLHTSVVANNLGRCLQLQSQFGPAESAFRDALAGARESIGADHPETVKVCTNLATTLQSLGQLTVAEVMLRDVLAANRRLLGDDHPQLAAAYNSLAYNLQAQGRFAVAQQLFGSALAICRKAFGEEHPYTSQMYGNLAQSLDGQGEYARSERLFRHALAVTRQALGDRAPETAGCYNNLATNLLSQRQYAEAEKMFRQALEIYLATVRENHVYTALCYQNLGLCLSYEKQPAKGEEYLRKAYQVMKKLVGDDHPDTARALANLGHNLTLQGRFAAAEKWSREALEARRKQLGDYHKDTVQSLANLGTLLYAQGKYAEAAEAWRDAAKGYEVVRLRVNPTGLGRAVFAAEESPLLHLAACLARLGEKAEAWKAAEAGFARGLLDELAGTPDAASGSALQQRLARTARLDLLDQQIVALSREKKEAEQVQLRDLTQQRAARLTELARESARTSVNEVFDLGKVQAQLTPDAALLFWLDLKGAGDAANPGGEHWACLVRRQGLPQWLKLSGSGPESAWVAEDDDLPRRVAELLSKRPENVADESLAPVKRLHRQRLASVEAVLKETGDVPPIRHLVVIPAGAMAGVPVEALTDRFTVSYAPSATVFARLRLQHDERPLPALNSRPALLLGDPNFQAAVITRSVPRLPDHGVLITQVIPGGNAQLSGLRSGDVLLRYGDKVLATPSDLRTSFGKEKVAIQVWRDGQTLTVEVRPGTLGLSLHPKPAAEALRDMREADLLLAKAREHDLTPLPGTRREVQALARLFTKPELLVGSDAAEQQLDRLAGAGRLREFGVLHLATHTQLDDRIPGQSALALARDRLPDPVQCARDGQKVYTGMLTVADILNTWQLDADLVTLSACETGLGRDLGGEGYLGFTQAIFRAHARSLLVSLWKVDDDATVLLMERFYQNLLGKRPGLEQPLPKDESLREAKSWLRALTAKDVDDRLNNLLAVRGAQSTRPSSPKPKTDHPYAHRYYWSAFVLIGDPG
jgi:tetratricopeptide (TPR) repeat protein